MALYKNPLDAIFGAAEKQNKLTLVRDQYTVGLPTEYIDPEGITNTEITISAASPRSPYEGSVTVTYARLDLQLLSRFLPSPILGYGVNTIAKAIDLLNKNYGLTFVVADLVPGAVQLVDDVGSVTLTATENSLGWIGEVTLPFARGNIDINTAITNKNMQGMVYPARDETKPYGEMYSYWRDFTPQKALIDSVVVGQSDLTSVRDALIANSTEGSTSHQWVTDASGRYSLLGASVVYNGLTSNWPRSNKERGFVLVIDLGVGSLGYSGQLIMHYGVPPLGGG
jgi:hypothetical protein